MSNNKPRPLAVLRRAISDHLPNEREREIHHQVLIQGRMENNVARQFGLTVAQVQHVVCRVERWLAQVQLPIELHHLQTKHLRRLEHQWREAMTAWYRSCAEEDEKQKAERPARRASSDVRYLEQARKILAEIRAVSAAAAVKEEKTDVAEIDDDQRAARAARRIATAREQLALDGGE